MAGVFAGHSHQHKNGKHRAEDRPVKIPAMPSLKGGWLDLDAAEARRLEVWGRRIIEDIKSFRHRQRRRQEGRQGVSA